MLLKTFWRALLAVAGTFSTSICQQSASDSFSFFSPRGCLPY